MGVGIPYLDHLHEVVCLQQGSTIRKELKTKSLNYFLPIKRSKSLSAVCNGGSHPLRDHFIKQTTPLVLRRKREENQSFVISLLHAAAPREPVTLTPPLLCLEILSPEDRLSRAQVILTDYLAMGVAHIWLVDPMRRAAYTYDTAGLHIANPTRLSVPETRILLDLTGPFEALD